MTDNSDNIVLEHLKRIQSDLSELKGLRSEVRDGFASMRTHLAASHGDQALMERRVMSLESDMDRIKRRLDIADSHTQD